MAWGKEQTKAWRDRKKAEGICYTCGTRPVVPGRSRCAPCLEKAVANTTRRQSRLRYEDKCISCGAPTGGYEYCLTHYKVRKKLPPDAPVPFGRIERG